jgi:choline dehydrogenase-like flavoprotein
VDVLIVGAGPAAAGAALALSTNPEVNIRVLDVGGRLEAPNEAVRQRMSLHDRGSWSPSDVETISRVAHLTKDQRLPEKRNFGSSFPFDDFGQLQGVRGEGNVNTSVISGAYGGFSNTWGAQTMVYSAASFVDWPFARDELEPDYRAILSTIPYAGEYDDLEEYFPLWGPADPLPPLSDNATRILERYRRHRLQVRRHGVILGKSRLALKGSSCVSCGLCMTGCPYSYVYSASHTFDQLIASRRVEYFGGYAAEAVGEEGERPYVVARNIATGVRDTFSADKVFLGCGAIGTTRLVASSLEMWSQPIHLQESAQFLMPLASIRGSKNLSQDDSFTLNQFNIVMPFDEAGRDLVQIHGYPYNKSMDDALPAVLRTPLTRLLGATVLKHLTVGLGYLPSWWSPGFDMTIERPSPSEHLAQVVISPDSNGVDVAAAKLRAINARLLRVAPYLGVVPVVPMVSLSAPGKSYHYGGSFPHSNEPKESRETDLQGRIHPWRNVHLVDASVFPTVSATTFTLTIMANAHRIARGVAENARG